MLKWLNKRRYKIVEHTRHNGKSTEKFYTAHSYSFFNHLDLCYNNRWGTFFRATTFNSIQLAEKHIQMAIWQNAYYMKCKIYEKTKQTRTIHLPPWGNK